MTRWKTARPSDPDFRLLLTGDFACDRRALPRRSLNVGAAGEEVTFEIVPLSEIERPAGLAIALHALRPETLALSLGPMLAALAHLEWALERSADREFASLALVGVLLFHASLNLLNDYVDHMTGFDRAHGFGGSRAIQRGWAKAASFRAWGLALLAGAVGAAIAVAWARPQALLPLGFASLGAAYYLTWGKAGGRRLAGAREFATFALGGPFLVSGFVAAAVADASSALEAAVQPSTIALGFAFGFASLSYGTLGHLESLMHDSLAGVCTLASRLGFDRAKLFVACSSAMAGVSALAYAALSGRFGALAPMAAATAAASAYAVRRGITANSPLSSSLRRVRDRALWTHWALALGAIIGLFWSFARASGLA